MILFLLGWLGSAAQSWLLEALLGSGPAFSKSQPPFSEASGNSVALVAQRLTGN